MKNKIKLALLLALSLSFLGACNNQNTSSNPEVEKESTVSEAENEVTDKMEKFTENKESNQVSKDEEKEEVDNKDLKTSEEKQDEENDENHLDQASIDKDKLFEEIKNENDKVIKVHMQTNIEDTYPDRTEKASFIADPVYDENQKIIKGDTKKELSNGHLQEIKFVENDDSRAMILEIQPGEEETTVSDVKIESYDIKPDYHRLVQAIMDMKDDLEVSEEADAYKLNLKDKAMDVIKYVQEEYIINVSDLEQNQIEKTIEVEIDKETKLLKKFSLGLKPKVKELEGNKLTAETILSDHELEN